MCFDVHRSRLKQFFQLVSQMRLRFCFGGCHRFGQGGRGQRVMIATDRMMFIVAWAFAIAAAGVCLAPEPRND
jgi:hypothetical protein